MKWASLALAPTLGACLAVTPAPPNGPAPALGRQAAPGSLATSAPAPAPSDTPVAAVASPSAIAPSAIAPSAIAPSALAPPPPLLVGASYAPRPSPSREPEAPVFAFETHSIEFGPQTPTLPCVIGGRPSRCVKLADGPWLVTDYETLDGCPDALHLGSSPAAEGEAGDSAVTLSWTVRVSEQGVHDAKIAVARDARLFAGLEPRRKHPSNSPRCRITWSGQRLRGTKAPQPALMESPYR